MSKYLAVSLLTIAFLVGFMLQAGAFGVVRGNLADPSTAYPQIPPEADEAFNSSNNAAVYNAKLDEYVGNNINTTSISGFWQ